VAWIGRAADVPAVGAGKTWNIGGKALTPGLVDPHTHIFYGEEGWSISRCCRRAACRRDLECQGGGSVAGQSRRGGDAPRVGQYRDRI